MHNSRRYDYNQHRYHFIKLEWNESGRSAEYTLKFNGSRRGLWIGSEPPKGKDERDEEEIYVACILAEKMGQI
jgi:hypothetical protein